MAEMQNAHDAIDALKAEVTRAIDNFMATCSLSETFKRSLVAGLLQSKLAMMELDEGDTTTADEAIASLRELSADEAMTNLRERMRVASASFMMESPLSETMTLELLGGLLQSMLDVLGRESG